MVHRWWFAGALLCLGCETPPVVASQDPTQSTNLSHIDGFVVAQTHARGNAVLFLFDVNQPPPPVGPGKPLSFTVVPKAELFGAQAGDPTSDGPFTAPFHFSVVPAGTYIIEGFIDLDGCLPPFGCRPSGFIPWFSVTDEPNAGDVGGGAADPGTGTLVPVTIDSSLTPATGVSVVFSDVKTVPVDRPAFSICAPPGPLCATQAGPIALDFSSGQAVLELVALQAPFTAVAAGATSGEALKPTFLAQYVKVVNGVPQDVDYDNPAIPDLWPKIVVRKVNAANPLQDENTNPRGFPIPGQPLTILAAGVAPTPDVVMALTDGTGAAISTAVPVSRLTVVIKPAALDLSNPTGMPTQPPAGLYALYVVEPTGQTWRLPNEMTPGVGAALGLNELPTQSAILQLGP